MEKTFVEAEAAEGTAREKNLTLLEGEIPESLAYIRQLDPSIIDHEEGTSQKYVRFSGFRLFKNNGMVATIKIFKNSIRRKFKGTAHTWHATLVEGFLSSFYGDWVAGKVWGLDEK